MAFIRYKKFGKQEYAYETESYRDPVTKKPKHRQKYLGVVIDKDKGIFEKRREKKEQKKSQILDFGDSYMINEITSELPIISVLKEVFGEMFDTIMSLVFHRIEGGVAMCHAENWYDGNYVSNLFTQVLNGRTKLLNLIAVKTTIFSSLTNLNNTTAVSIFAT